MGGKPLPLCIVEQLCIAKVPELISHMSVMDMANVTCAILVGRIFFSLCSEVSYIYWGAGWWDGEDLCSEFTSASWSLCQGCWKWWRTAGKDLGIFQATRVLAVFVAHREHWCSQDSALLQAIWSVPGFRRKLVLGRGRALLNLFAVLEGLSPWLGLHSPACISHIPDPRWKRKVCLKL